MVVMETAQLFATNTKIFSDS